MKEHLSKFRKPQLIAMAGLTICYAFTAIFILSDSKLFSLLFFLLHSIAFLVFYYVDSMQNYDMVTFHESLEDALAEDTIPIDETANINQELLTALQEKCRIQTDEISTLKNELSQHSEKNLYTENRLSELEKWQLWESLLPESVSSNTFEPINIIAIAHQVIDELEVYAVDAKISVQISSSADSIMVKADSNRIRLLFRNIIDNSIKYMQKAGSLIITISTIGDDIFIVLKDNGNGLSESETEHVLELNYQGSNRISGNGLGLTQAKAIVNSYGGTIYAKSTLGRGMGIYIQLPTNQGGNSNV